MMAPKVLHIDLATGREVLRDQSSAEADQSAADAQRGAEIAAMFAEKLQRRTDDTETLQEILAKPALTPDDTKQALLALARLAISDFA